MAEKLFSVREAAMIADVRESSLRKLLSNGSVQSQLIDGQRMIPQSALGEYISRRGIVNLQTALRNKMGRPKQAGPLDELSVDYIDDKPGVREFVRKYPALQSELEKLRTQREQSAKEVSVSIDLLMDGVALRYIMEGDELFKFPPFNKAPEEVRNGIKKPRRKAKDFTS